MRICAKHGNLPLLVSLLSRKGTCDLRAAKALTTFLRPTKSSTAMFQWLYGSVDPSMKDVKDWEVSPSGASTMGSVRVSPFSNPSICSSRIFVCISPLFGPTLKKSPWRASQRPINFDWCWWLPEIACLLSLTSWPRPKWIKVECNAVKIHWKMSSHGQMRTVWHP